MNLKKIPVLVVKFSIYLNSRVFVNGDILATSFCFYAHQVPLQRAKYFLL